MAEHGLALRIERDGDNPRRFRAIGEIDATNWKRFVDALTPVADEGGGDLLIDLSALAFLDSSGIRALLIISSRVEGRLILLAPGPAVARVLEIVRADTFPNVDVVPELPPEPPPPAGVVRDLPSP